MNAPDTPAFPVITGLYSEALSSIEVATRGGVTLRAYLTAAVLPGLVQNPRAWFNPEGYAVALKVDRPEIFAKAAVAIADAVIAELFK